MLGSALAGAAGAETLTVSVASSLRDVIRPIVAAFEGGAPGLEVVVNHGSSGLLARQIEDGAPVDVLVSAGWPEIERLRSKGLLAGEPVVIARNRLVVVVPAASPWLGREPRALLASPSLGRIAIGDPATVPAGAYARTALRAAGLWEALGPRLVYAGEVRQALTYADQGSVDAAVVYATDARLAKTAVPLGEVPGAGDLAIEAVAARTARGEREVACRFLSHLRGDPARRAFVAAGFLEPR